MRALAVVLVLLVVPGIAGADPTAESVLEGIDAAYGKVKTATITFEQEVTNVTFNDTAETRGRGWIARPDRMRWEYLSKKDRKPTKMFVSDGKDLTVVDHLNQQVMRQPIGTNLTPAALRFLTGARTLTQDFTAALGATTATSIAVELTPKQASAAYAKIVLVVDPATFAVRESTVTDSAGNTNRLIFTSTKVGTKVTAKDFVVNLKTKALRNYRVVTP